MVFFSIIGFLLVLQTCILLGVGQDSDGDLLWYREKLNSNQTGLFDRSKIHVLRLAPGEDLLQSLYKYARVLNIKAASVVSVVGSLQQTNLRYANQSDGTLMTGHWEITSVVGNIDFQQKQDSVHSADDDGVTGSGHIHAALSDESGATIGGHMLTGNIIYTTAEITMIELTNGLFKRILDDGEQGSGYKELQVFHEE